MVQTTTPHTGRLEHFVGGDPDGALGVCLDGKLDLFVDLFKGFALDDGGEVLDKVMLQPATETKFLKITRN